MLNNYRKRTLKRLYSTMEHYYNAEQNPENSIDSRERYRHMWRLYSDKIAIRQEKWGIKMSRQEMAQL